MVSNDVKGISAKPHHSGLNGINGLRLLCKTPASVVTISLVEGSVAAAGLNRKGFSAQWHIRHSAPHKRALESKTCRNAGKSHHLRRPVWRVKSARALEFVAVGIRG